MSIKNLKIAAGLLVAGAMIVSCTKVNRDDDFVKGDPPPVSGGYTNSSQIAAANLIGYWNFNGDLKDSVTGVTGTNNGMKFAPGIKGQALQGSANQGDSTHALAPASAAIAAMTKYTVSCWVNTSQNIGATGIVSIADTKNFWGNINIFFENGGTTTKARFKTIFEDNGSVYDNGIQDVENGFNNWVQYVITYDGAGVITSYVNGTLAATKTIAGAAGIRFINVGPIVFGTLHFMTKPKITSGADPQGWAGFLPGKLDEVRIYNRALTALEVSALAILERQGR